MSLSLAKSIAAILYYRGEEVEIAEISRLTQSSLEDVKAAIHELGPALEAVGLIIVAVSDKVELRTNALYSELIETIRKEELSKDLGKAGLETLSIVLYNGPSTRSEIDYVRGVNSTAILRNLLIRGLIERVQNPKDQRSFLYRPSIDLLAHLGVGSIQELPEYESIRSELETFEQSFEQTEKGNDQP